MPKIRSRKLISFDTETTGIDLYHSCKPFFVTICDEDGPVYWEWDVDPLTRQPLIPDGDKREIVERINAAALVVAQNSKFDVRALASIDIAWRKEWWWAKLHDTLFSGHLLESSSPHDLTTMALRYLRIDIQPYEDALHKACSDCRTIARRDYPDWLIAKKGLPGLPSAKGEKLWKWDMWLPRAVAKAQNLPPEHEYWTVLSDYSNADSYVTRPLWEKHEQLLKEQDLWKVYLERRKLVRVINSMEERGVTYSRERLTEMASKFSEESKADEKSCLALSGGKLESLPKSGTTKAMTSLLFDEWKLPVYKRGEKKGEPSLDAEVIDLLENSLPRHSKPLSFIRHLKSKRKRDTCLSYMESYERFGLPCIRANGAVEAYRLLHPSLNATGSATLRMSGSNPNQQNIGKQDGFNIRYCFGPAPGREWWSLDYENLELRLPAYEANEIEMIKLFEQPDVAPYYGSYHLLVSHVLWPREFEQCLADGITFKDRYKATLYQWIKNGNFAVQYGAIEESGTADRAYHMPGAQRRIQQRFKNVAELNRTTIAHANRYGYVYTMTDKHCGAYRIQTPKTFRGQVKPTIPLNYHIQGTAMWGMCKAMVRCHEHLEESLPGHYITMQIHDEMVFDFPKGRTPTANVPKALKLKSLMEQSGDDIGIPLKVDCSYHPHNWSKSEEVAL